MVRKLPWRGLALGLLAALLALAMAYAFRLERWELLSYDQRLRWRRHPESRLRGDAARVLIVAIDDKTLKRLRQWPLPRSRYVPLIDTLRRSGADCIGLDLTFENPQPGEDGALAAAMRDGRDTYLGVRFDLQSAFFMDAVDIGHALDSSLVRSVGKPATRVARMKSAELPPPVLARACRGMGSITIVPEVDGVIRRFPLVVPYQVPGTKAGRPRYYASLPLLMAAKMLGVRLNDVRVRLGDAVEIGPRRIPIDDNGEVVINYYGGFHTLYPLSYVDVVGGAYKPHDFRGKGILVGNTASGGFDIQVMPYGGNYPGVEMEATVLQNLLDGSAIWRAPGWVNLLLVLGAGLVVGAARRRAPAVQAAVVLAVVVVVLVAGYWLLASAYVWIEVVRPILAAVTALGVVAFSTFLEAQTARARVKGAVDALAHVSQAIANSRNPSELLPTLERGIQQVLAAEHVALRLSEGWLRSHLLPDQPAAPEEPDTGSGAAPLTLHGAEVGSLSVRSPGAASDPALVAAVSAFAALMLENAALSEEARTSFLHTTWMLADMIEARDSYTAGHCSRVMEHACAVAERLGLPAEDIEQLRYAALLHDVGKIGVREAILNKPGKLTPEEMAEMRRHPALGRLWLKRRQERQGVADLVASHHEWWDGSGYPSGLAGDEIPIGARILAIADVWDALTSERPYRGALPAATARSIVESARGTQFDPVVLDAFLAYLDGTKNAPPAAEEAVAALPAG